MITGASSSRPLENSYWVVVGQFLAGEYPGAPVDALARPRLRALLESGVTHFVDLTEVGELTPYEEPLIEEAVALGVPMVYARHPIRDGCIPTSPQDMTAILDAIDAAMDARGMVYVHCWGGIGRTGTVVGCWLVRHELTGEDALAKLASLWPAMVKSHRKWSSPETPEQFDYVRNWREPVT